MSDDKTAGSVEALRYEIDEDGSIYRHDAKDVQVWISLNGESLDSAEVIPEARELARRANLFPRLVAALDALVRPLEAALNEKTVEQIFGGATSKERQANAKIYQARVAQELDNLPMAVNAAINTLREAKT